MTPHTLLDELRALGVQLSTDGTTLNIDAPKGVITPNLQHQLAAQKQELITLLRPPDPSPSGDDEAVYLFHVGVTQKEERTIMAARSRPLPRRFTPLEILNRATEYEIRIALDGKNLVVNVPATLEGDKKDKALAVMAANKLAIINYLQGLVCTPLCYTCLDENKEIPALPDDYEGIMYCADHHPNRKTVKLVEKERTISQWQVKQR